MMDPFSDLPSWQRFLALFVLVLVAHGAVLALREISRRLMSSGWASHVSKSRTIISLITSLLVFTLYFLAVGLSLNEFGVSLTAYLASASIIGLAVAFGSQGLVQDVVSGLTIVFTNLFDIWDVIEISGQVGAVERFGMRFTVLRSPLGAEVIVPNRSITNVIVYERGYIRCLVDIVLPREKENANKVASLASAIIDNAFGQFSGIFRAPAEVTGPHAIVSGHEYLRVKFRIWPGRGGPIETVFRQNMLQAIREIVPEYSDWMVAVNYEVENYQPPSRKLRRS